VEECEREPDDVDLGGAADAEVRGDATDAADG